MDLSTDRSIGRKPSRMFSLGRVPRRSLTIARSELVGNLEHVALPGTRYHLRFGDRSVRLDDRLVRALAAGRSTRVAAREHDDIEWALFDLFASIAGGADEPLGSIDFGRAFDRAEQWEWSLDAVTREVAPRG